ncbi:hypothetical protein [Elizabethkingia miricola]|uniref:hypothetical protein n=1 Tax=Elizabethkingia miricola TaxID=172045 RepID=UPI0015C41E7E|nr:hypothetical protein [Elizabethkingia miricola]
MSKKSYAYLYGNGIWIFMKAEEVELSLAHITYDIVNTIEFGTVHLVLSLFSAFI